MAENLDSPSFGNFSIQDTMEMGLGSQELMNDLMGPETSTSNPDDIQEIVKEAAPPEPPKAPDVPKGKEIVPKVDGQELSGQDLISSFLGDNTEEETQEAEPQEVAKPKKATKLEQAPAEEQQTEEGEQEQVVSQFTALSRDLFKLGVFSKDEEEEDVNIDTPEAFLERFQNEKKKGAIEMVNSFIG
jgi:hypothetical protein